MIKNDYFFCIVLEYNLQYYRSPYLLVHRTEMYAIVHDIDLFKFFQMFNVQLFIKLFFTKRQPLIPIEIPKNKDLIPRHVRVRL